MLGALMAAFVDFPPKLALKVSPTFIKGQQDAWGRHSAQEKGIGQWITQPWGIAEERDTESRGSQQSYMVTTVPRPSRPFPLLVPTQKVKHPSKA